MELNQNRDNLLFEVITDITRKTYDDYASDEELKQKIAEYIFLIDNYKDNPKNLNKDNLDKLAILHEFFYRTTFNENKPLQGTINRTPIIDIFKSYIA